MRKSGFTIAELIICFMIMFIVMGAVVTIPFKKAKITRNIPFKDDKIACDCNTSSATDAKPRLVTKNVGGVRVQYCEIQIDNPTGQNEFHTIRLIGGGAAGSPEIGGDAGETKVVHYPTLNGTYRIYLGQGGTYGTAPNGGNTVLYKVLDSGNLELVEFASGAVASNETIQDEELSGGATEADLAKGLMPNIAEEIAPGATICGAGGNALSNGNSGGVIISW